MTTKLANHKQAILGITIAGFSVVMFSLAFLPPPRWPLAFLCLAPMVIAQHRAIPDQRFGFVSGIGVGGFFGLDRGRIVPPGWRALLPVEAVEQRQAAKENLDQATQPRSAFQSLNRKVKLWFTIEL